MIRQISGWDIYYYNCLNRLSRFCLGLFAQRLHHSTYTVSVNYWELFFLLPVEIWLIVTKEP